MKKRLKNTLVVLVPLGILALVTALSLMPPEEIPRMGGWFGRIPHSDKFVHFCFYFLLVSAIRFAKSYRSEYTKACPWRLLVLAAVYGGVIEVLQGVYFGRGCEIWDEAANVLGAVAAIWGIPQRWHERWIDKIGRD